MKRTISKFSQLIQSFFNCPGEDESTEVTYIKTDAD